MMREEELKELKYRKAMSVVMLFERKKCGQNASVLLVKRNFMYLKGILTALIVGRN